MWKVRSSGCRYTNSSDGWFLVKTCIAGISGCSHIRRLWTTPFKTCKRTICWQDMGPGRGFAGSPILPPSVYRDRYQRLLQNHCPHHGVQSPLLLIKQAFEAACVHMIPSFHAENWGCCCWGGRCGDGCCGSGGGRFSRGACSLRVAGRGWAAEGSWTLNMSCPKGMIMMITQAHI